MKELLKTMFLKQRNIRLFHSIVFKKNLNRNEYFGNKYKNLLNVPSFNVATANCCSMHDDSLKNNRDTLKIATIKVASRKREPIDYSLKHSNHFITTVKVFNEYLLNPSDLVDLQQYKRRSPYDENGQEDLITIYLRSDIEKKALEVWGSLEALEKEKNKRRKSFEQRRRYLFNLKKTLRVYKNRIAELEDSFDENSYNNVEILKRFSGKVLFTAIFINAGNFLLKIVGWMYTGSASLFAEAVHSFADTVNQIILAFGLHQSLKKPSLEHPYGYSNMTYITSLISGVGIFCFGTCLSWYHGITAIVAPHELQSLSWAIALLSISAITESLTLVMAYLDIKTNANKVGLGFWEYVSQGYNPNINVVLLEDIAAVSGVLVAATCMYLTEITGNHLYDACGSFIIGGLLGMVSSVIIYTNTVALIGKSIPQKKINSISNDIESDVMIRSIYDIKTTDLGSKTVMFKAEVDVNGREITRSYLERIDIEKLLEEVQKINTVQDLETFFLKHGENIVDRVGDEIDRIERNLRKNYPDLQHVDLEIL